MSIKLLTRKYRRAMSYDGSSMDKAVSWETISPSGTTGTLSTMYGNAFWVAVGLTAGTTYSSTFGGMDSSVTLYDSSGTQLAQSSFDWDSWVSTPLSYTPSTSGTYYLKFSMSYYEGGDVSVDCSPRPSSVPRPAYSAWETSSGFDDKGFPKAYRSASDAGVASGIPASGLVFYAPLNQSRPTAETGQTLNASNVSYTSINGIACAYFDGNASIYTSISGLPAGNSPRSVSLWTKLTSTSTNKAAFSYGSQNNNQLFGIQFFPNGDSSIRICGWAYDFDISMSKSDAQQWHNIVLTYDSATICAYVDGVLTLSQSAPDYATAESNLYIGSMLGNDMYFYGYICGMRIYNQALGVNAVAQLADEFMPA